MSLQNFHRLRNLHQKALVHDTRSNFTTALLIIDFKNLNRLRSVAYQQDHLQRQNRLQQLGELEFEFEFRF